MELIAQKLADNRPEPYKAPIRNETYYIRKFTRILDGKSWKDVVRKAVEQAKEGDAKARDWLTSIILQLKTGTEKDGPGALAAAAAGRDLKLMLRQVTKTVEVTPIDKKT